MLHEFTAPVAPVLSIVNAVETYPIRRVFCVGRNYADHAAEMGGEVDREAPWYFTKSSYAVAKSGQTLPYPPGTQNYHHEMELVVALGADVFQADPSTAATAVFGYGCGLDMTRRDRQQDGKDHRRPWSLGKDFENSAVLGALTPAETVGRIGAQRIWLMVNDQTRQNAALSDMVWSVSEIISHLSHYYHLGPGDVIMTGTPAGVSAVQVGDNIVGQIDGLSPVHLTIGPHDQGI